MSSTIQASNAGPRMDAPGAGLPASLPREMLRAITDSPSRIAANEAVLKLAARTGAARALLHCRRRDGDSLSVTSCRTMDSTLTMDATLRSRCLKLSEAACQAGEVCEAQGAAQIVAAPIFVRGSAPEALALVTSTESAESARQLATLTATHLTLAQILGDFDELGETVRLSSALLELLEQIEQAAGVAEANAQLVTQLQRHFRCHRVALGTCRTGRHCKLVAMSDSERFDAHSEFTRAVEAVLDETVLHPQVTVFPNVSPGQPPTPPTHQRLAGLADCEAVVSLPLTEGSEVTGALVLMGTKDSLAAAFHSPFLETLAPLAGRSLSLVRKAWTGRVKNSLQKSFSAQRRWLLLAASLLAAVGLSIRVPYRVSCNCELQPTTRRYVAVPYDGKLAEALVAPGEVVDIDQELARLDGREIQWELDAVVVRHNKARKTHDKALAQQRVAEAQLAKFEMKRLALQRKLLEHRIANLSIKSPIGGIVLSGDLRRTEGAPLTIGQTLFEIAPLERMVVELAIPESEVAHVREADEVRLTLDAFANRSWLGTVEKIHPRASLVDKESVFVAEVMLDNAGEVLRPGMKGRAKVKCRRHPLIWNLFHRPYAALMRAYYNF